LGPSDKESRLREPKAKEEEKVRLQYSSVVTAFNIILMAFVDLSVPHCLGQEAADAGQSLPNVSGTGSAGHIAIWENSTTLTNSKLFQSGGNVGVNGNLSISGSILAANGAQMIQAPTGSSNNFSAGWWALPPATTGAFNTALGDYALYTNASGSNNLASGWSALYNNSTGGFNTASGVAALFYNTAGDNNTASGFDALNSNTMGGYNTAIGSSALNSNTTGFDNTAIGTSALGANTAGSNNIAVGFQAGINVTTSNNISIGNEGTASDNGTIRIGCQGSCYPIGTQSSAFIAGIFGTSTGLPGVSVMIDSNGNLGTVSSSRRYKEDIEDMGEASNGILRLRPVTFRYKKAFDDGSKPIQYGLIAEEVAEVYPDLVARSTDGRVESVKYHLLDSMLLNELQKQNATIDAQGEQIRSLEERLAKVEAALRGTAVTASAR
jgi:hypothetical protein